MRSLTQAEIQTLQQQQCRAADWHAIRVSEDFTPASIHSCHFEGKITLGKMTGHIDPGDGISRSSGIYNSRLVDCSLADGVCLQSVGLLAGYDVGPGVVIEQTGKIVMSGESRFGNGEALSLINEAGGRECMMYDRLSAQVAYLMSAGRHEAALTQQLSRMIGDYAEAGKSHRGSIGEGAYVSNCGVIRNVRIGAHALLEGASLLEEGSIAGSAIDPVRIGAGVLARHFIIQSGSHIDSGAILHHCFIGQGVRLGKQFSAEHSAFFANSEGFHGEACSIFAGPYTVSHHKSTLLIAGIYSFYNAGSGTNQSNHMYKLGPLHQGIVDRGAKTGSFAYMMWPSRVGAFSVVTGKHAGGFDASEFPFSYITVDGEKSLLTPAMNLFTVGTRRDSDKWPKRDRRKDVVKWDLIHFDFLNPYIVGSVLKAQQVLDELHGKTPKEQESLYYKGLRIKRLMLRTTRKYYDMIPPIYLGSLLARKLEASVPDSRAALSSLLEDQHGIGSEKWLDLAGLLAPESRVQALLKDITAGDITDLKGLETGLQQLYGDYEACQWSWALDLLDRLYGIRAGDVDTDAVALLLNAWRENSIRLNNMIAKDAEKEFDQNSKIGYGLLDERGDGAADFESVRGSFDTNSFVLALKAESESIASREATLHKTIQALR